jgi:hypothetical protein
MAAGTDVSGMSWMVTSSGVWEYLPTSGENQGRQVASLAITNDGIIYALVGNGTSSGELQRIDTSTGQVVVLETGLYIRANSSSAFDSEPRPRPVAWTLAYDQVRNVVYMGTEDGLYKHELSSGVTTLVGLPGISIRGIEHDNDAVIEDPAILRVATRTLGVVEIVDPCGAAIITTFAEGSVSSVEDIATIDASNGSYIYAARDQGVYCFDGANLVDVTPTLASGTGANGAMTLWTSVAVIDVNGTNQAALGMVNTDGFSEWIYKAPDVDQKSPSMWEGATAITPDIKKGNNYFSPPNRQYSFSGASGPNQTGTWSITFNPSDPSQITTAATLSMWQSNNFTDPASSVAWSTFNENRSILSITDLHIDGDGNLIATGADHNSYVLAANSFPTGEPMEVSVSGIRDGWSSFSVGTGMSKVTVFAAADDNNPGNPLNDIFFHVGNGPVTSWGSTGYNASFAPPGRPGGVFGWDNSDGTYTFVVWTDGGDGVVRSTYDLATGTFSAWQAQATGGNLSTGITNQERQITGAKDGSVLFLVHLADGVIYRSLNGGVNWNILSTGMGNPEEPRSGRIAYSEATDTLFMSDASSTYKIVQASGTPTVTTAISGIGPSILATDSQGCVYAHERGQSIANLYRFSQPQTASSVLDAVQIASIDYQQRIGDLANTMTTGFINGKEYIVVGYQAGGIVYSEIPRKC